MARAAPPELGVVFDTNILFTQTFGELVTLEVSQFMASHSNHHDLAIKWYLPEVVRDEREYQMQRAAVELLPSITKIEKLLGHGINITADNISGAVTQTVDRAVNSNKLLLLRTDPAKVDWIRLMKAATFRSPPFDPGKNEKGFRDSLIAECFLQLVESCPRTAAICRVALVAKDELLRKSVEARAGNFKNVHIFTSIEELGGLINTLVSTVSEALVAELRVKATSFFYEPNNEATLYYKGKFDARIRAEFAAQFAEVPEGADSVQLVRWSPFATPQFVKKVGSRYHWSTAIAGYLTAYRTEPGAITSGIVRSAMGGQRTPVMDGHIIFGITWSVQVNQAKRLSNGKIDSISLLGRNWVPTAGSGAVAAS
jgi:hypothetical protein